MANDVNRLCVTLLQVQAAASGMPSASQPVAEPFWQFWPDQDVRGDWWHLADAAPFTKVVEELSHWRAAGGSDKHNGSSNSRFSSSATQAVSANSDQELKQVRCCHTLPHCHMLPRCHPDLLLTTNALQCLLPAPSTRME